MAINFPSNPNNGDTILVGNTTYTFDSTSGAWDAGSSGSAFDGAFSSLTGIPTTLVSTVADMAALIAKTGMTDGDQAFVTANNNLYIYSGTGWYKIATVQNDSPSAITGVDGTYSLAIDGTPTVITAVSTDPEGFPLTWTYSTSGLGSIATISQVDNVFTITPSTDDTNFGTFTLTINATDGVSGAVNANTSISLTFKIENSKYTTLLATAVDTSDNSITDSSTNNHAITVTGDATAGTFSPYRHGGYSAYFDGVDSRLFIPNNELEITTQDFTIEAWINFEIGLINIQIASNGEWLTGDNVGYSFKITTSGKIQLDGSAGVWNSGSTFYTSTNSVPSNEWAHIAICRESGVISSYINGIKDPTTVNYSSSLNQLGDNDGTPNVGYSYVGAYIADNTVTGVPTGYMADFHFKLGSAKYNSNFDVPTERLTAETGTTILVFNDNTIKDNSTNSFTVTPMGGLSLSPIGLFDNLEYKTAVHGGSVYFDGTDDGLIIPAAAWDRDADYTVECWAYAIGGMTIALSRNRQAADGVVFSIGGSYTVFLGIGRDDVDTWDLNYTGSVDLRYQWHHLALTHDASEKRYKIYVDGINVFNGTSAYHPGSLNTVFNIGCGDTMNAGTTSYSQGWIADHRITDSIVYTSNFTPPTVPLSSTGSVLHIQGTDASIIDKSQSSNLKLFGNTTGSTTQIKFADTKSMYFDGTGDMTHSVMTSALSSQATIEFWNYPTATNKRYIFAIGLYTLSSVLGIDTINGTFELRATTGGSGSTTLIVDGGAFSANTWYHVAIVKDGTTYEIFIDGISKGTGTYGAANTYDSSYDVTIGSLSSNGTSASYPWSGYIQDFRITNGLARYTANFTPPTEPLKG